MLTQNRQKCWHRIVRRWWRNAHLWSVLELVRGLDQSVPFSDIACFPCLYRPICELLLWFHSRLHFLLSTVNSYKVHSAILFCWWSWACSNQPLILIMVVTFAITMRCFQKMNGKLTVSWIFGWFAVVNDRMSALESHTVESISTTALFTIQTLGYYLFVWKQCLFIVYFVVFLFFVFLWRVFKFLSEHIYFCTTEIFWIQQYHISLESLSTKSS